MRIKILQIFFTTLFVLVGAWLYHLQIIKGPFYNNLSSRNSIRLLNIAAPRGNIYDRFGKLVAGNTLSFGVFIIPQEVDDIDAEMEKLAGILGVSKSGLERNYKRNRTASFAPCELIRGVSKKTAILIEESRLEMPGVLVKEIPFRNYYYNASFSHVVGYIGEIDQLELELLKPYGYNIKDLIGKDGVERFCDRILRGKNGGMQIQVDNRGRQVKVMSYRRPKSGRDVYLTLDAGLQKVVYNLFNGQRGAAIFMDPHNGEILSLISSPSYDPNEPLLKAMRSEDSPLLNRAIMGVYPPGSIFKLVTSIAALESKSIRPDTGFVCVGKFNIGKDQFDCWNKDGHGYVDLEKAIAWSCNVYFYHTALLTGADKISKYAILFGLGRKTGIELFGESNGFVPSKEWKRAEKKEIWYPGDTANFSIGQGDLLVTPLQIARMVSSIANGGALIKPHVLKRVGYADAADVKIETLKVAKENIDVVRRGMRKVIEDPDGTGNRAASGIVSISAKTGTVQVGPGIMPHGWFVGFAPSENPKICFVVFLENAGSGGDAPAEIAKLALEYWFREHKNDKKI
ncbi:MAG: penicillin-binding protein 2 [Omnitrophica bacterium GWA2_41_15]|nr:MAG: penicillin-binding protein 2 [Omnitrophica bacterium GWA2_41_15]HAZ10669.1 penicillin-binding protein 2 [Candidatus Omnitrophota bacterium]